MFFIWKHIVIKYGIVITLGKQLFFFKDKEKVKKDDHFALVLQINRKDTYLSLQQQGTVHGL